MSKVNFNKPVFLYDDTRRGEMMYVTEVVFQDRKSILVNTKAIVGEPGSSDCLDKETIRFHINAKTLEANSDDFSFYFMSNYKEFLDSSLKNKCFKAPKLPQDSIKLPRKKTVHQ